MVPDKIPKKQPDDIHLLAFIKNGDADRVKDLMLTPNVDVNFADGSHTPLTLAVHMYLSRIRQNILKEPSFIEDELKLNNRLNIIVAFLEDTRVKINELDHRHLSFAPLHEMFNINSSQKFRSDQYSDLLNTLLRKFFEHPHIDINVKDHSGNSPIMSAIMNVAREDTIKMFLEQPKIDLNVKNNEGKTIPLLLLERLSVDETYFIENIFYRKHSWWHAVS